MYKIYTNKVSLISHFLRFLSCDLDQDTFARVFQDYIRADTLGLPMPNYKAKNLAWLKPPGASQERQVWILVTTEIQGYHFTMQHGAGVFTSRLETITSLTDAVRCVLLAQLCRDPTLNFTQMRSWLSSCRYPRPQRPARFHLSRS